MTAPTRKRPSGPFASRARPRCALLEGVTAEQLERRGTFAEYGPLTLRSLVHYLASHDLQHLACMDWLLGQLHAEASASDRLPAPASPCAHGSHPRPSLVRGPARPGPRGRRPPGRVGRCRRAARDAARDARARSRAAAGRRGRQREGSRAAARRSRGERDGARVPRAGADAHAVPAHHGVAEGAARRVHAAHGAAGHAPATGPRSCRRARSSCGCRPRRVSRNCSCACRRDPRSRCPP